MGFIMKKNTLIIRNTVLGLRLYTSLFSCRLPRLGLKRDDQGGVLGEVLQRLENFPRVRLIKISPQKI
jgi:hypothetical protein